MKLGPLLGFSLPRLLLAPLLFVLRYKLCGLEGLGIWAMLGPVLLQFLSAQMVLGSDSPEAAALGFEGGQWGWFLFALSLPGLAPVLGAAGLLLGRFLVLLPLEALLWRRRYQSKVLLLLALFALVGVPPFSSFGALLATLLPLMVDSPLQSMKEHFDSAFGIWASVVMLSVVYQTGAFGYFYWDKVLNVPMRKSPRAPLGWPEILMALGLSLSLILGIARAFYGSAFMALSEGLALPLPRI